MSIKYLIEFGEIFRTGKDGEISIATKLGCDVEYACLAAPEQRLYSGRLDRRKDFEYRVAYQTSHQGRNKLATIFPIHANALAVRGDTTKPIRRRRFLQA
jgi:hypothetical protein